MISGRLDLFTEEDLDRLDAGVSRVLETTGIHVCSEEFLDGLVRTGARVDRSSQSVRFPARLVEDLIEERIELAKSSKPEVQELESTYRPGVGIMICPFVHDYERQARRHATRDDLIEITHWADVDTDADRPVGQAVTMSEVDPRVEPIEAYALLLQHTSHPEPVSFTSEADQIEFLLELSTVHFGRQVFPTGANFMTSPLTFGDRVARYLLAAIRWGRSEHSIGVMPICGGNSPMTIAGNIVVSAAELLGAWLTVKALQPEATFTGGVCNGVMDMRRAVASFNAPEALLADLGVCELFERRYGGRVHVAGGSDYIDGRVPGLQVAHEKTTVAMAIAAFTGRPFSLAASGGLEAGKIFSPVQFILERELGAGLWRLSQGIVVNDDTLGLATIESVGAGEGKSYLETEHTLRHYRDTWFPQYLARGMWQDDQLEFRREREMLDAAYEHYKACAARYSPLLLDEAKRTEIQCIVERARRHLLV